ncbi:hypothetical protein ACT3UQ_08975 [Glutamicibacter sp. AOP12-B1-11]|uniref:hypothetical protein n=1 Tax=Glutamicibacter sp. AOP12-B1-11 TaxID=3457725 RepID=UPI00403380BA
MDTIALLISALSLGVAFAAVIFAVCSSRSSDKLAQKAIEKANTANQLSTDANIIAEDSKRIAIDSREIGKEALTVAQRADLRQSDTSNIHWECDWEEPGIYVITNRGDDEARDVRIILTVDEEKIRSDHKTIPGGSNVKIECPQARATYLREIRAHRAKIRDYQTNPLRNRMYISEPTTFEYQLHSIHERIDWSTQAGNARVHDESYPMGYLGDFD